MKVILNDDEILEYIDLLDKVLQRNDDFNVEYVMNKLQYSLKSKTIDKTEELENQINELEQDLKMCTEVINYYAEEETVQLDYKHNGDFEFITHDGHYSLWESGQLAREVRDMLEK